MKKIFLLLLLPIFCFSQAVNNHVQKVSLPSPDAVALGKFGETPVDYFTGVPSISVPIYTIQAGPISLSIGLSQHSSGLRPAETPSWVGHGWVLNAGGMISRTVQGIEDEYTDGFLSQGNETTFNGTCFSNSSKAQPINAMLSGDLDGEPDIFSYAVAGISGKFYLNASGTVVKIPENDLKITYTMGSSPSDFTRLSQFVITNTDGTQYIFGTNASNYKAIELSCVNQSSFKTASSWKLVRIVSVDSQYYIDLNYTSEVYSYGNRDKNGTFGVSGYFYNKMEIEGHRLTSIVSSTGREVVTFVPSSNPREDVFGLISGSKTAYALDRIEIQHGNFCKKFQLGYQYTLDNTSAAASVDSENKKRLLLNSVQEKSCNDATSIPAYSFKYDISDNYLPHKLTAGTDRWAFYNGAENNKDFLYNIPYTKLEYFDGTNNIVAIEGGADKNAHFSFSKLGSLTKITYPTGGHSAFEYEANAVYDTVHHLDFTYFPQSASRSSCSNVYTDYDEFTATLTDVANTYFELAMANTGNQFFCCNDAFGSPLPKWVVFSIRQGSTQVFSNTIQLACGQSTQLLGLLPNTLQNGVAYTFRVNPVNATGKLKLMLKSESITYANTETGGIRIKKITHHDGIDATNNIIKTYEYLDPVLTERSSGILYNKPLYGFVKNFTTTCNPGLPSINFTTHFFFEFSPVPLSTFEGHQLCYKSVKESTPNAGFKRYNYFFVPYAGYQELPYAPPQPGISTGNLESESDYISTSAIKAYSFNTQKSDALTYNNTDSSIFVKAYWGTNGGGGSPIGLYKVYNIGTKPFRLSSVENHKDGLTTTTSFLYRDDKEHLLPIRTKTTHPDGTLEKDTISYAKELNQTDLLSRHMIHLPLEIQRFVNDGLTGGQKTTYSLFSSFPRPQTLQSYNTVSNIWETEATFNSYDAYGNPTSVTNRGWQAETYSWDKDLLTQKTFQDFTWQYEYEANTSLLKKYTEPSALFTTYGYDALSRNTSINQYNGKTSTTLAYAYSAGANKITVETTYDVGSTLKTEKEFDGLGRPTYTRKIGYGSGNQDVVTRVDYDNAGRVKNEYLPGFSSAGAYTSYTYEDSPLRRPTTITPPAPLGSSTLTYGSEDNQWTQTTTNALNEYKKTWTDTRGRMRKSTVGGASITNTTTYEYDDRNNLLKVMPHGTSSTDASYIYSYTYNGRNLVTKKKLPEKNDINLNYDSRDLATHLQDGIQPVVYTEYDVYGRPTRTGFVPNLSSTSISNTLTETSYKMTTGVGFGQPYITKASLLNTTGEPTGNFITREITAFDAYHRPTNFKSNHPLNLDNVEAITGETTFNRLDQITANTTNVKINSDTYTTSQANTYEQGTRLKKRTFSFNGITVTADEIMSFDAFDNPLQTKIGGNLQTVDYSYYGNGFLHKINGGSTGIGGLSLTDNGTPSENTANDLFAMELNYQTNGNISEWKQQNRGFTLQTYAYTYDGLQRIKTATNGTQAQSYNYKDALGNFSTLTRTDLVKSNGSWILQAIDNMSYNYSNSLSSKIQSIVDVATGNHGYLPNNGTYSYDGNGNTTYDPANKISTLYNYLNLPSKFTKDDQTKLELLYDANGTKWQEKTYNTQGSLLGQKSYIEHMEFEGNGLSLVHHPTGFVKNLKAAQYLNGIQNGDIQSQNIISTQKIGEGKYEAEKQVLLLPGFEATARDKFSATIKSQSGYQWQYTIADHLGNIRILFTDKNNDGLIRQSSDNEQNELLNICNYSPFGLELSGSHQNIGYQNANKFGGKEENGFSGYYDYGARWFDQNRGVWGQGDALAEKYFHSSLYSFTDNNPINRRDLSGNDWFRIADGTLQYDPAVQSQKDLQEGQTYIGDTFQEKTKRGSVNYRKDGSILYSNQIDAYNRI